MDKLEDTHVELQLCRKALRDLIEVMRMQVVREDGTMHISQSSMRRIWDNAIKRAEVVLAVSVAPRKRPRR